MWAFGRSVRSSCIVGTTFVAASRRIRYLPSHFCLRVCARSSPFAPYHGVLLSLSPYPHLFVCCFSWCCCTPYAKRDVRGWGPSFLFLSLLPGWSHTFVGLGWWRGPCARCSSRVRGVAQHGNILVWLPPFPPHLFVRCVSCRRYAPCMGVTYLPHPHLCVFRVSRRRCTPYANGLAAAGVLSCHGILPLPSSVGLILLRWCGM